MVTLTRAWYDDRALDAIWDEPAADYLEELTAKNRALLAQALRRDEEEQGIEIDAQATDDWIASADALNLPER